MPIYSIAGKKVYMNPKGAILKRRAEKYLLSYSDTVGYDIFLEFSGERFDAYRKACSGYSYDEQEYAWAGGLFYKELMRFNGFYLHGSAVALNQQAFIFSANSGTGKSTHAALWLRHFKSESPFIINDDKPAILLKNGEFYAYGTPFSGKNDLSRNEGVKIKALCFLQQANTDSIEKLNSKQAIIKLYGQILPGAEKEYMSALLSLLDKFLTSVPVFRLKCTVSENAVVTAYNAMKNIE